MKELLREMFKKELGFAPDADEIKIKSDKKIAAVAEINGHYYDYYKATKQLNFRDKVINDTIEKVIETFVWDKYNKKEIEYIVKYDEELQKLIKQYRCSNELYDTNFRSEFSFALQEKLEDNKELKEKIKKESSKSNDYATCIFAGTEIKSKTYFGVTFEDVLNKNNIKYKANDLDLGIVYALASGNSEREYIYDRNGKTVYAYEFVVGTGDDFESTVYRCDTRLTKEFLIEFDYLNSQNEIEWFRSDVNGY